MCGAKTDSASWLEAAAAKPAPYPSPSRTVLRSHSQGRAHRAPSSMESPLSHYRARPEAPGRDGARDRRFAARVSTSPWGCRPASRYRSPGLFSHPGFPLRQSAGLQHSLTLCRHTQDEPSADGRKMRVKTQNRKTHLNHPSSEISSGVRHSPSPPSPLPTTSHAARRGLVCA